MWFTYLLLCQDNSLYCGSTNNLEKRFSEHQKGLGARYTHSHKPLKIVYSEKFKTKSEALIREAEIKKWKRAKKINNLKLKTI